MTPKRVTIKDVALSAGVSITTVSHVLNDVPGKRVNEDTRARVREAAARLGYRPNQLARSLRTQRSGSIALVGDEIATTPFAGQIIVGAQEVAMAHGAVLLVVSTGYDSEVEARELEELQRRQVDGFLYATLFHREVSVPDPLDGSPVVALNAYCDDPKVPWIVPDEEAGGWDAADVLVGAGHRRIGMLANVDPIPASTGRTKGFTERVRKAGIDSQNLLVAAGDADVEGGYQTAMSILDRADRPTAIFCFNDRMAMGAYRAAAMLGLAIPTDVSIVGFDNQDIVADGLFPGLTTIALPHHEMGTWAAEQLFARIEAPGGAEAPTLTRRLRGPVVRRGSVAPPPR